MCVKLFGLFFLVTIVIAAIITSCLFKAPIDATLLVPELEKLTWSADESKSKDTSIKPFEIKIKQNVINDLKRRLEDVRLTEPLIGIQQQYGMNTNLLKDVINYWKTKYNWIEREKYMNTYPQFKTNIQGLDIHFIHVKPKTKQNVRVLPLLLLHGWPGSVIEFYDIIPLLTTPRDNYDFVFEVIVPSLPGYGFSDAAEKPGLGPAQISTVFNNLMKRLGHKKYYVQGGDFGAIIIQAMGKLYPNNLLGIHSNMCFVLTPLSFIKEFIGGFYPDAFVPPEFQKLTYPFWNKVLLVLLETGYFHIQATKPDTLGVGLGDSPAGLAAYILEKFVTATNITWKERLDGGLKEKFTYDHLLDNIMMYWLSNSMTTAVRLYSEYVSKEQCDLNLGSAVITPPSACARFVNEIVYQPDWMLKEVYVNLVHSSDITNGGHFAALEVPHALADDIFIAIKKIVNLNK